MESEASGSRVEPDSQQLYRNELFILLRDERFFGFSSSKCNERLLQYIMDKCNIVDLSETLIKQLKDVVKVIVTKLLGKWRQCKYMFDRFNDKHANWLSEEFKLPEIQSRPQPTSSEKKRGRPKKDSSERIKKRKVKPLVSRFTPENLCLATEASLVKSGKRKAAQVLKLAVTSSPKSLKKMEKAHSCSVNIVQYSPEEALDLIVDLNLTKAEYKTMRLGAKKRGADIYPSYHVVTDAKLKCYPLPKKRGEKFNDVVVGMLRMPTYLCSEEVEDKDSEDSDDNVDDHDKYVAHNVI